LLAGFRRSSFEFALASDSGTNRLAVARKA